MWLLTEGLMKDLWYSGFKSELCKINPVNEKFDVQHSTPRKGFT